jgi:hypothetical protein
LRLAKPDGAAKIRRFLGLGCQSRIVQAMKEITARIKQALAEEEANVERSVFDVRLVLLLIFGVIAAINARAVSAAANLVNLGVFVFAAIYKLVLYLRIRRRGYHPAMKYLTSVVDVALVFMLMLMYARIETPAVALKNYGTLLQGRFVGGDYYDFLPLSETSLLVVVADVSGKGVPAALIMSEVRASTHLLASMRLPLEELVQRLNALLFKSIERKYFVSFFAAEIDTKRQMLHYVNAGHPPPLVCSRGRISALAHGNPALGIRASLPQLAKQSEPFPAGGMLVAFTDGICERTNGRGEQFGDNRLEQFVQRHAELNAPLFVAKLLDDVKSFGQDKILDDDVAIAVAKFC